MPARCVVGRGGRTIGFLAGDDSGSITAAAIPLDGGISQAFAVPEGPVDLG